MSLWTQRALNYFRRHNRGWLLSLFGVVCLVYLPFLGNAFFFEDLIFFSTGSTRQYVHSYFNFDLRWFPYASLDWTAQQFSDAAPHLFHLGNTLLHLVNVILIFFLLRRLVAAVIPAENSDSTRLWGAWFGALIFACHPVAVYAVGYVVQRSVVLATLFALVMQLSYLHAMLSGQKRWLLLSVLAYFLALFSEEHSILVPAVLGAMTILLREENRLDKRTLWLTWGTFITMGVLLILRVQGMFGSPYQTMAAFMPLQGGNGAPALSLLDALTQTGLFFRYLLLWLLPNPAWMAVDIRIQAVTTWASWQGWAGALVFFAYGVLALWLLLRGGRKGLAGLALLYPWSLFWGEFFGSRAQDPFVLYRSYLWLPGMLLFVPLILQKLPGRRTLLALGLAVLLLVPLAWNRLWVFADSYRLWNDAALLLPAEPTPEGTPVGGERILFNRAMSLVVAQKWQEAAAELQHVVELYPQLPPARHALGMSYVNLERFQEAVVQFDAGIALSPDDGGMYFGKGVALLRLHKTEQVPMLMKKACELSHEMTACLFAGLTGGKK